MYSNYIVFIKIIVNDNYLIINLLITIFLHVNNVFV